LRIFNCSFLIKSFIYSVFLLFITGVSHAEKGDDINIGTAPAWVAEREVVLLENIPVDEITDGVFYQLLDTQKKVATTEPIVSHYRYIMTVTNKAGVDYSSQINLDFDPSYQKIVLNGLFIIREGKRIDKLQSAQKSLLNRETKLENQIYNGSLTLNILLDDLQVGDSIDYSYTRFGNNPVYKGIFAYSRTLNWNEPVQDQYVRVLWGKKIPLFTHTRNISAKVTEKKLAEFTEYQVHMHNADTLSISSEVPSWYDPYGKVSFSESESWGDVIDWAETLYQSSAQHESIVRLADEIKQKNEEQADQIAAALKYTQNNIRYVGLEMGVNSHLPTPAHETLTLKYGDCKDKALLFISLLKALGINAYPALVDTKETKLLAEKLPAVNLFNHVIVTLHFNGKRIWLDPTLNYQEGQLGQLYQPDYGYALVVKSGETSLTAMENSKPNSFIHIEERYGIAKEVEQAVSYQVISEYFGDTAHTKHSQIERDGKKKLSQDYEAFYQSTYPKLTATSAVDIVTDKSSGILKLTENYVIDSFWKKGEVDYKRNFYLTDIRNAVYKPEQVKRNAPLWFEYPNNITNKIIITFEEDSWEFDDSEFVEDNDFFFFKRNISFSDKVLNLSYQYHAKADHIPANQIDNYLVARKTLRSKAYYGITKYGKLQGDSVESDEGSAANWILIAAWTFIICFVFIMISWRIESSKRPTFSESHFFPISLNKFLALSIVTFGTYSSYWLYRNWKAIKQKQQSDIMPIARGIFSIFWFYPLFNAFKNDSLARFSQNKVMLPFVAAIFALLYLILSIASSYSEQAVLSVLVLFIPLIFVPMVQYVNKVNQADNEAYHYNSKWNFRTIITVIIFLPMLAYTAVQGAPFMPSNSVFSQSDIMEYDMKYLYRKNVVPVDETIHYFYSDAFLSIRDDGNGFTDNRIFSYWQDDDEGFQLENVVFTDIKDISVKYAEEEDGNTIITITRFDDTNFKLFVSSINAGDKQFVDKLTALWQSVKVS